MRTLFLALSLLLIQESVVRADDIWFSKGSPTTSGTTIEGVGVFVITTERYDSFLCTLTAVNAYDPGEVHEATCVIQWVGGNTYTWQGWVDAYNGDYDVTVSLSFFAGRRTYTLAADGGSVTTGP